LCFCELIELADNYLLVIAAARQTDMELASGQQLGSMKLFLPSLKMFGSCALQADSCHFA